MKMDAATMTVSGLEKSTRPLVFTSAIGCRASENFDISSENYFLHICQYFLRCRASNEWNSNERSATTRHAENIKLCIKYGNSHRTFVKYHFKRLSLQPLTFFEKNIFFLNHL